MAFRTLSLLLIVACLGRRSADAQTIPGGLCGVIGAPIKCIPLPANVFQEIRAPATFTTTTTCNNQLYCGRSNPFQVSPLSSLVCEVCPVPSNDINVPRGFANLFLYDVESGLAEADRSRWQSAVLPNQQTAEVLVGNLRRTFIVASFSVNFFHTIPQSVRVERSLDFGATFSDYIFFAVDCLATFNLTAVNDPGAARPSASNPQVVVCVPIVNAGRGGRIFYNLRDDRIEVPPGANPDNQTEIQIDTDPVLRSWLSATDFRITLNGVTYPEATVGNSSFNYYSATQLSVVGTCQCFGHASGTCEAGLTPCACEHRTMGINCETCQPGFVDVPWRESTLLSPFECQECNCNMHAVVNDCVFTLARFMQTGSTSGGVCQNCRDNTAGPNCETCATNFYPQSGVAQTDMNVCIPCACNAGGVRDGGDCTKTPAVPATNGLCFCKANTMGRDCSQCTSTSFNFNAANPDGCTACACVVAGTIGASPNCDSTNGQCMCKANVMGLRCNTCRMGFYNLDTNNAAGCQACDCVFGNSEFLDRCDVATGQCTCRPGFTGRRCETLLPGYYVPDYDTLLEGEDQGTPPLTDLMLPFPPGSSPFRPTGRGFAIVRIGNNNQGTLNFVVPGASLPRRAHTFCVTVRYVIMDPVTSGLVSFNINTFADSTRLVPMLMGNGVCGAANLGTVLKPACVSTPCRDFTFTLTFEAQPPHPSAIYVDSVVLRPNFASLISTDPLQTAFLTTYRSNLCREMCVAPAACNPDNPTGICKQLESNANAELFEGARICQCSANTQGTDCNDCGGQCVCARNVTGRTCNQCEAGTHSLQQAGCTACACDPVGSFSQVCDFNTGQCRCRSGRTGLQCAECMVNFFPVTGGGCAPCNCHPQGSTNPQCSVNGVCTCIPTVTGNTCDMCNCQELNTVGGSRNCTQPAGQCMCGPGSTGVKCENCVENFFFATGAGCTQCQCNMHATTCNMGGCIACQDNTIGQMCENCLPGFYGDATGGTTTDCQQCMCNNWATLCVAMPTANMGFQCTDCTGNTMGAQCQTCLPNHFGMPLNGVSACQPCQPRCNDNINPAVPNSCDANTGECLLCTRNTVGSRCELCAPGFFGDATVANGCQACACNTFGSRNLTCNRFTGACECHPNVVGAQCTQCAVNHFSFMAAPVGCDPCSCNSIGSTGPTCLSSGQCICRPNVVNLRCDQCAVDTYDFSTNGCTQCNCETAGTVGGSTSCAAVGGMCNCEANTIGRRCDACSPGFFFVPGIGCTNCPCNGRSNECTIGGICMNCQGNSQGNNCEICQDGFYNDTSVNPLGVCQPCACSMPGSTSAICDKGTGQCLCLPGVDPNTRTCSMCADGFYALSSSGCTACGCSMTGSMSSVCNKVNGSCACVTGFGSRQCDVCVPGFYNFALGCPACGCSTIGASSQVCDVTNGNCQCNPNIIGRQCTMCRPDFFGFSLSGCQACECNSTGRTNSQCDLGTGDCPCQPGIGNPTGSIAREQCTQCMPGTFGFSVAGCQPCGCQPQGSRNEVCNVIGGQCNCHVNVIGRTCDSCLDDHVVFSNGTGCFPCPCNVQGTAEAQCNRTMGACPVLCFCDPNVAGCLCDRCDTRFNVGGFPMCQTCNCSQFGSVNGTCDAAGQCLCREGALGLKCDTCAENFFLTPGGCQLCPECYGEVRDKVLSVRMQLETLRLLIDQLLNTTLLTSDPPVVERVATLLRQACILLNNTQLSSTLDPRIEQEIRELNLTVTDLNEVVTEFVTRARPTRLAAGASAELVFSVETQINATIREVNLAYNNSQLLIGGAINNALILINEIMVLRRSLTMGQQPVTTAASDLASQATTLQNNAAQAAQVVATALSEATMAIQAAMSTGGRVQDLINSTAALPDYLAIANNAQTLANTASATAMDQLTRAQQLVASISLTGDGVAIVNAGQAALQLINRSVALDALVQENCARASRYYALVANLSLEVNATLPQAVDLRMQAMTAYQQARAYSDRVALIVSRSILARDTLANFNAETAAARELVRQALATASNLSTRAMAAEQQAQQLISSHTQALADARSALQTAQSALTSAMLGVTVTQANIEAVNGALTSGQTVLTMVQTTFVQPVEEKNRTSLLFQSQCTARQLQGQTIGDTLQQDEAALQAASTTASVQRARADALYQRLLGVGSIPLARLTALRGEFDDLRSQLSSAQVAQVVARLSTALSTYRLRLTSYQNTLNSLASSLSTVRSVRNGLLSTCPIV